MRGIGLSAWVSKQLERLVLNWIWPYIRPYMDPDQMGGVPGCSIEHYIIKMTDFILKSMDGNHDAAVLAAPVDYSKAYDRMLNSDILCNLVALNVPYCAVKFIKSYLTGQTMCTRYKGSVSSFKKIPGGGPQCGLLTSVLFILQVNKAGGPCPLPALRQTNNILPDEQLNQEIAPTPTPEQNTDKQSSRREGAHPPAPGQNSCLLPAFQTVHGPAPLPAGGLEILNKPPCHDKSRLHKNSFIDELTLLEKFFLGGSL